MAPRSQSGQTWIWNHTWLNCRACKTLCILPGLWFRELGTNWFRILVDSRSTCVGLRPSAVHWWSHLNSRKFTIVPCLRKTNFLRQISNCVLAVCEDDSEDQNYRTLCTRKGTWPGRRSLGSGSDLCLFRSRESQVPHPRNREKWSILVTSVYLTGLSLIMHENIL